MTILQVLYLSLNLFVIVSVNSFLFDPNPNDLDPLFITSTLVANEFKVLKKIGGGTYGSVYTGVSILTHEEVAIKVEDRDTSFPTLHSEYLHYNSINNSDYFPRVHWFGVYGFHNALVLDHLGQSLDLFLQHQRRPLSHSVISMVGEDILRAIEIMHENALLHRDIKPNNILLSRESSSLTKFYLADLGSAQFYCLGAGKQICEDPFQMNMTGDAFQNHHFGHILFRDGVELVGTVRYASLNSLMGFEQSRRDDLESLGYTLIDLFKPLPWQGLGRQVSNTDQVVELSKLSRMKVSLEALCLNLPAQMLSFIQYVRSLGFYERPNYQYLRRLMTLMKTYRNETKYLRRQRE